MLSQLTTNGHRLIIVDEPENHLHPEAVHYIDCVLQSISANHQILISTHNPIFVNRNCIDSNLIIDGGRVVKASRIDDIRKTLGVVCSDNLIGADYVIVVEGASDKEVIQKCIQEDKDLVGYYNNKSLVVQEIGGTHNLQREVYLLQQLCCNYVVLLDYDSAGKQAANEIKNAFSVSDDRIRFFMKKNKRDTELEDLYNPKLYRDLLLNEGISIDGNSFKNDSWKWSDKIEHAFAEIGKDLSKEKECQLKETISSCYFKTPVRECLTSHGYSLISSILAKVKADVGHMIKKEAITQ